MPRRKTEPLFKMTGVISFTIKPAPEGNGSYLVVEGRLEDDKAFLAYMEAQKKKPR